jgi:hypothetical protein
MACVLYQNDDHGTDCLKGLRDGLGEKAASGQNAKSTPTITTPVCPFSVPFDYAACRLLCIGMAVNGITNSVSKELD